MLAGSRSYLQLMRFPLIFAGWSDFLCGYFLAAAAAGVTPHPLRMGGMLAAATLLGAGWMTLSDCFCYESDKEHGHAGPLPAGLLSAHAGFAVGLVMLLLAIACSTLISAEAGLLSVAGALLIVLSAAFTRDLPVLGAVNVGFVRAMGMVIGMAFAVPNGPFVPKPELWGPVAAIFGYVFIVTQIASEEARLNRERLLRLIGAMVVLLVALNVLLYVSWLSKAGVELCILLSVFVAGTVGRLVYLGRRVARELTPESVQKLAIGGFVAAIVLNANFVAFAGRTGAAIGVLFLLLPTFLLLRFFHILFPGTRTAMD